MTPAPLQVGQAPSELELNSAGLTPLALAKALRIGSSSPVYVSGLLRRDPLIAAWSYGEGRAVAFASDCGPHWAPPAFVEWDGYAKLWQNLVGWVAGK